MITRETEKTRGGCQMPTVTEADMLRSKGYLPATEVAKRIGKHVTNIYRAVEDKRLRGIKVGRHWYVRVDSLTEFLGPAAALFGFKSSVS